LSRVILVKIQKTRRRAVQKASNAENKKWLYWEYCIGIYGQGHSNVVPNGHEENIGQ
jgi:hypothetical protein